MLILPGRVSSPAATIVRQIDLSSSASPSVLMHVRRCLKEFHRPTIIELGLRVFENVACNAWVVSSIRNSLLHPVEERKDVFVSSSSELDCVLLVAGPESQERNIVLPTVGDTTDVTKFSLDSDNLSQGVVSNSTVNSDAVVQSQTDVEGEALKIAVGSISSPV
jgi:hypothetical protein